MTRIYYVIAGAAAGAFIGYLLRPSIWPIGQLPFLTVITRGANLRGMDLLLQSTAQQSFNDLLIGAVAGAVLGYVVNQVIAKNNKAALKTK
ncbi:MAG: hypothetical protein ACYCS1_09155 [Gammaproteobacteria bacterium]